MKERKSAVAEKHEPFTAAWKSTCCGVSFGIGDRSMHIMTDFRKKHIHSI